MNSTPDLKQMMNELKLTSPSPVAARLRYLSQKQLKITANQ